MPLSLSAIPSVVANDYVYLPRICICIFQNRFEILTAIIYIPPIADALRKNWSNVFKDFSNMILEKYSFGVGDRFSRQGKAQLQAVIGARKAGVDITPVTLILSI
jgi:hypothetical protein